MVAAWISAETGVGPSMASGNQMCSGNIADLPAPPMKINTNAQVITETPMKVIVTWLGNHCSIRIGEGYKIKSTADNKIKSKCRSGNQGQQSG